MKHSAWGRRRTNYLKCLYLKELFFNYLQDFMCYLVNLCKCKFTRNKSELDKKIKIGVEEVKEQKAEGERCSNLP